VAVEKIRRWDEGPTAVGGALRFRLEENRHRAWRRGRMLGGLEAERIGRWEGERK